MVLLKKKINPSHKKKYHGTLPMYHGTMLHFLMGYYELQGQDITIIIYSKV